MKLFFVTPLVIFLFIVILFISKLIGTEERFESPLLNKKLPSFELSQLEEDTLLTENDLAGRYTLLNIFGSWCISCKFEHPFLLKLKQQNIIEINAVNWRDKKDKAIAWLQKNGNPYNKIVTDNDGTYITELGVTGAPETFLIAPDLTIKYRLQGILTEQIFNDEILPLISSEANAEN